MVFTVKQQVDLPSQRKSEEIIDVTFCFSKEDEKDDKVVRANKTILSFACDVFKTQVFGSIPPESVIFVKDSTVDVFDIFIDILYNVKIDLQVFDVKFLGDLFYLAEKYGVNAVKAAIVEDVKLRKIKLNDILEIMKVAEANAHLVEFAESLEMLCAKLVLKSTTGHLSELFEMSEVENENSHVLHKLMRKVNGLKNSKEVSSPHSVESPTPSKKRRNTEENSIQIWGRCPMCDQEFDIVLLEQHAYNCGR